MFRLIFNKKQNVSFVSFKLLKALKVKANANTVDNILLNNPEYPSLLAVSDCLTELSIANETFKLDKNNSNPKNFDFPFIAHFPEEGGRFVLVHEIKNRQLCFRDEKQNNAIVTEEEFLKRWSGIVLFAEADESSGEKNYKQNRLKYFFQNAALPIAVILLLSIFSIAISQQAFSVGYVAICIVKLLGLSVSILLLIQSINANNPFIKNLCNFGGKNNCNAILKSDAAKVTSWLSWSEVGFFYFAGSLLSLLFVPSSLPLLAWLNLLALPYIIYSIGYQYRSKNWCILCCTVQILLGLEFLTSLLFKLFAFNPQPSTFNLLISALSFLSPIILWAFVKPFFLNSAK